MDEINCDNSRFEALAILDGKQSLVKDKENKKAPFIDQQISKTANRKKERQTIDPQAEASTRSRMSSVGISTRGMWHGEGTSKRNGEKRDDDRKANSPEPRYMLNVLQVRTSHSEFTRKSDTQSLAVDDPALIQRVITMPEMPENGQRDSVALESLEEARNRKDLPVDISHVHVEPVGNPATVDSQPGNSTRELAATARSQNQAVPAARTNSLQNAIIDPSTEPIDKEERRDRNGSYGFNMNRHVTHENESNGKVQEDRDSSESKTQNLGSFYQGTGKGGDVLQKASTSTLNGDEDQFSLLCREDISLEAPQRQIGRAFATACHRKPAPPLTEAITLRELDVLCCERSRACHEHRGNEIFRAMCLLDSSKFKKCTDYMEQWRIALGIVVDVRKASGRFLTIDATGRFYIALTVRQAVIVTFRSLQAYQLECQRRLKQCTRNEKLRTIESILSPVLRPGGKSDENASLDCRKASFSADENETTRTEKKRAAYSPVANVFGESARDKSSYAAFESYKKRRSQCHPCHECTSNSTPGSSCKTRNASNGDRPSRQVLFSPVANEKECAQPIELPIENTSSLKHPYNPVHFDIATRPKPFRPNWQPISRERARACLRLCPSIPLHGIFWPKHVPGTDPSVWIDVANCGPLAISALEATRDYA